MQLSRFDLPIRAGRVGRSRVSHEVACDRRHGIRYTGRDRFTARIGEQGLVGRATSASTFPSPGYRESCRSPVLLLRAVPAG